MELSFVHVLLQFLCVNSCISIFISFVGSEQYTDVFSQL